jgi:hypothetical protein
LVSSNFENISYVTFLKYKNSRKQGTGTDEGITNGPSIFTYLVFGPGEKPARRLYEARKAQHTDLE